MMAVVTRERPFVPAYRRLRETGELAQRAETAYRQLKNCDLCARYCRVDRTQGIAGAVCRTGERAWVASFGPHHGEEGPLRGSAGSGTIFFT
jgi:putative pyruvate formate lyase activating enzyme